MNFRDFKLVPAGIAFVVFFAIASAFQPDNIGRAIFFGALGSAVILRYQYDSIKKIAATPPTKESAGPVTTDGHASEESADERKRLKAEKSAQRAQDRHAQQVEAAAREAADSQRYGRMVVSEIFGGKTIRIYDKGYVRLSGMFLGSDTASWEKLISIEDSSDVSKKSGLGRGLGMVVTQGVSAVASNMRGDVYLSIVTDEKTHMLHEDPPTARALKASKSLAATGRAIISSNQNPPREIPVPSVVPKVVPEWDTAAGGIILEISTEETQFELTESPPTSAGKISSQQIEQAALAEIEASVGHEGTFRRLLKVFTFSDHAVSVYEGGFIKVQQRPIAAGGGVPQRLISIERRIVKPGARFGFSALPTGTEQPVPEPDSKRSANDRLRQLNSLRNDGLLNDEEYEQSRKRVIEEL